MPYNLPRKEKNLEPQCHGILPSDAPESIAMHGPESAVLAVKDSGETGRGHPGICKMLHDYFRDIMTVMTYQISSL